MFNEFNAKLTQRARWGLAAGAVAILAGTIAVGAWLLRAEHQVLFADLRPQDAALMTAELDKLKIDYRMSEDGSAILVDQAVVHATRMKLLGKEMPLHGAAGFELFNNGDFGMTEFAQKINYQRALQGEITRTILSLAEVREARVHLALPEEGLFKRASSKPKASITLSLKAGQALRPDQVSGIQRLVAGAVPGIAPQDVTIVDQQGVALTRAANAENEAAEAGSSRLDLKRDMEKLLARKATEVLERAFGAGQAMASVDVTLNMDQVRVTTEDVIGAPAPPGQAPTGVIVRERETLRDAGAPLAAAADGARASNSQRETEYQVGRRIEHVVTQPGAVKRIQVAAVVRTGLDAQQLEHARALVVAAVGGVPERGDAIVVQSLKAFDTAVQATAPPQVTAPPAVAMEASPPAPVAWGSEMTGAYVAAMLLAAVAFWYWRSRARPPHLAPAPALTEAERQVLATQLRLWLEQSRQGEARLPSAAPSRSFPESGS
jgi:flagellar M-ring protein FliF